MSAMMASSSWTREKTWENLDLKLEKPSQERYLRVEELSVFLARKPRCSREW